MWLDQGRVGTGDEAGLVTSRAKDVLSQTSLRAATLSPASTVSPPTRTVTRAGAAPGPPWAAPVLPMATHGTCVGKDGGVIGVSGVSGVKEGVKGEFE